MAGSVALCSQTPWILNTNLKDNILFGKDYNENLFELAIQASALKSDLEVWLWIIIFNF